MSSNSPVTAMPMPRARDRLAQRTLALLGVGALVAGWSAPARATGLRLRGLGPPPAMARDSTGDFHWSGRVDAHRWVRVRNLSGSIRVERTSGPDVEIQGHKVWRHGDPDRVRITMQRTGPGDGDVLVCALWGDESRCDEQDYDSHSHSHHDGWHEDNDVTVEFTVRLPDGVKAGASTVNGSVDVSGATEEVTASSVNGHVEAETRGGPVQARSVNGSVEAVMHAVTSATKLEYSSVNGSVHVTLPADLKADVELSTTNGSVRSDFPITIFGSLEARHMRGTIGGGGIALRIDTVNGSIELRKGGGA
jgi:hypothetical protein